MSASSTSNARGEPNALLLPAEDCMFLLEVGIRP